MQGAYRSGGLLCDAGSEIRLEGSETRRAKIINGKRKERKRYEYIVIVETRVPQGLMH